MVLTDGAHLYYSQIILTDGAHIYYSKMVLTDGAHIGSVNDALFCG